MTNRLRNRRTRGFLVTMTVWTLCILACAVIGVVAMKGRTVQPVVRREAQIPLPEPLPAVDAADAKAAVREWLKENTNTGEWEEVRWWGPVTLHRELQDSISQDEGEIQRLENEARIADARLKKLMAGKPPKQEPWDLDTYDSDLREARQQSELSHRLLDETRASLRWHKGRRPVVLCRLKFRTKNAVGATTLQDVIFEAKDVRAEPVDMNPYGVRLPLIRCPLSECDVGSRYVADCFGDDSHGLRERADANDSINAAIESIMNK